MTSNEVNFVSLADTFTVQFLNLLKLPSGISGKQNSLTGPVITGSFEKRALGRELLQLGLQLGGFIAKRAFKYRMHSVVS